MSEKRRLKLWLERLERNGCRDPKNPNQTLPPKHPVTRLKIEKIKTVLAYVNDKISLNRYQDKMLQIEEKIEGLEK